LDAWLEFAQGPLFQFTFAVMLLGLLRTLVLSVLGIIRIRRMAGNQQVAFGAVIKRTIRWLFPVERAIRVRPIYSVISVVFHLGLILVPIFLLAHVRLWKGFLGFGWVTLPPLWADVLTVATVVTGVVLFVSRLGSRASRAISRFQDYLWPPVLVLPFASGFLCVHASLCPVDYRAMLLVHVLSAELIFVLIPFTKIAHCVLLPLSQLVSELGWRFPESYGRDLTITLGKEGEPI
jgi:nitrate reductase gamma subunit